MSSERRSGPASGLGRAGGAGGAQAPERRRRSSSQRQRRRRRLQHAAAAVGVRRLVRGHGEPGRPRAGADARVVRPLRRHLPRPPHRPLLRRPRPHRLHRCVVVLTHATPLAAPRRPLACPMAGPVYLEVTSIELTTLVTSVRALARNRIDDALPLVGWGSRLPINSVTPSFPALVAAAAAALSRPRTGSRPASAVAAAAGPCTSNRI